MFLKTNVVIISKIQQMKHKTFKSSVDVFFLVMICPGKTLKLYT